ncbi:MAG TPA: hypothetical protein VKB89_24290 [Xanthobacteraceae bacterium]|nr:hypothetical protein [Xanthobacteraceae bacterium]
MSPQISTRVTVVLAALIAVSAMTLWFATNYAVMGIDQARYLAVVEEAVQSRALAEAYRLPFAPTKELYLHGDDCLTLSMLIAPQESRLKAAVSPRVPVGQFQVDADIQGKLPPQQPYCNGLAATLEAIKNPTEHRLPELIFYHRYIHGIVTVAALLLGILSFQSAITLLLTICYALLAWLITASALRLRSSIPSERRRATAFVCIGLSLALFYAVPIFDRSFCFAPIDIALFGFILFGLFHPLGKISELRLVLATASFGAAIAIFDRLVGGIPIALIALVLLVVLGEAQDRTLARRLSLALTAFITAAVVCIACKQLLVVAVWGPDPVIDFATRLGQRTGGGVAQEVSESVRRRLDEIGLNLSRLDSNFAFRTMFAAMMLLYSAFILGWGSHLIGAAIVILPTPLLLFLAYFAVRGQSFRNYPIKLVAIVGAAMIPFGWYLLFLNSTILHSSIMVRLLVLSLALAPVAWIFTRVQAEESPPNAEHLAF